MKHILLSTKEVSPQVLSETLYAIHQSGLLYPAEVFLIATANAKPELMSRPYLAFADTNKAQVKKVLARVDRFTQHILRKAFCGELVPQDPINKSAHKLPESIALARKEAEALAKAAMKAAKTNCKVWL